MEIDLFKENERVKVLPSLLACNFMNLENEFERMKDAELEILHYDVMDGRFVKNISFGESIFPQIHKQGMIEDVHLMVKNPFKHALNFLNMGCKMVSCHIECFKDEKEVSKYVQSLWFEYPEAMLGIAINPSTSMELLEDCLHLFDYVLVMSVEPGMGGQKFNMDAVERIKRIKQIIDEKNLDLLIQVDGGINDKTSKLCIEAGARLLVCGSYLFANDSEEIEERVNSIVKDYNKEETDIAL